MGAFMTPQHVFDFHAHEAQRYADIAANWMQGMLAEQKRNAQRSTPNGVRIRQLQDCALLALTFARGHLEMALAVSLAANRPASP